MSRKLSLILVAGGWHTEEHVKPVTPHLEKHGYEVVPLKLQTSGQQDPLPVIQDNVAPIVSAIKAEIASGNKVCLVGHSVSGQSCVLAINEFLSTVLETEKAGLVHLVFISCFLNGIRATAGLDWYTIDTSTFWAHLHSHDEIYSFFYNDMPRDEAQPFIEMLDSNRAQLPPDNIPETWKSVAGTYFLCLRDQAISPEKQRVEAEESGMRVVEVEMDHCAYVSKPREIAEELHSLLKDL